MSDAPTASRSDGTLRAELYRRADAGAGFGVDRLVDRAERLEANGVLGESMVAGRWARFGTPTEDWSSAAMDTYETFREWAERNDCSLSPAFDTRTRTFIGMDDVEEVVVFPLLALAVYEGDELAGVFPCTDGEYTYTVESALDAFERGDEAWLRQFDTLSVDGPEPDAGDGSAVAD